MKQTHFRRASLLLDCKRSSGRRMWPRRPTVEGLEERTTPALLAAPGFSPEAVLEAQIRANLDTLVDLRPMEPLLHDTSSLLDVLTFGLTGLNGKLVEVNDTYGTFISIVYPEFPQLLAEYFELSNLILAEAPKVSELLNSPLDVFMPASEAVEVVQSVTLLFNTIQPVLPEIRDLDILVSTVLDVPALEFPPIPADILMLEPGQSLPHLSIVGSIAGPPISAAVLDGQSSVPEAESPLNIAVFEIVAPADGSLAIQVDIQNGQMDRATLSTFQTTGTIPFELSDSQTGFYEIEVSAGQSYYVQITSFTSGVPELVFVLPESGDESQAGGETAQLVFLNGSNVAGVVTLVFESYRDEGEAAKGPSLKLAEAGSIDDIPAGAAGDADWLGLLPTEDVIGEQHRALDEAGDGLALSGEAGQGLPSSDILNLQEFIIGLQDSVERTLEKSTGVQSMQPADLQEDLPVHELLDQVFQDWQAAEPQPRQPQPQQSLPDVPPSSNQEPSRVEAAEISAWTGSRTRNDAAPNSAAALAATALCTWQYYSIRALNSHRRRRGLPVVAAGA